MVFRVANMRCGSCARAVTAALRGVAPAAEVRIDFKRREVAVEGTADANVLSRTLREAGFEAERIAA